MRVVAPPSLSPAAAALVPRPGRRFVVKAGRWCGDASTGRRRGGVDRRRGDVSTGQRRGDASAVALALALLATFAAAAAPS